MRVLFVTAEAYPLAKSGGLADVSSALPEALKEWGIDARILMPGYPRALAALKNAQLEARLDTLLGVEGAALVSGELPGSGVRAWLIHAPALYLRNGGLYQDANGRDWPDNARRFGFLSHVGQSLASGLIPNWFPDVIHANDWHAGLLPLLLSTQEGKRPATIFTIHNMAFQGNFPAHMHADLEISERFLHPDGIEFYGQLSFLKAGIRYADRITTVSPAYAEEILTPEFGCGLDGVLQQRADVLSGILNGIDTGLWNPKSDVHLSHPYCAADISGKRLCKAELQRELGLERDGETPLIGFVSRLTHQKMADVILGALPGICDRGAQFAVVGQGDPGLEGGFAEFARQGHPNLALRIGYEEGLAHRLQAGADILLAPARYEPCGLTQLYAMRYGTVPVVRRTGGLKDTVTAATSAALLDRTATGIVFDEASVDGLLQGVDQALALYREPLLWRRLQLQGMSQDFSWAASASRYADLYRRAAPWARAVPETPAAAASVHAA
ncbi:MAG TPA: glycogen synthase GlgA [Rhizomicrobium sp.]|nr:glycogen synthase GlgA [Rhizomicrobium sp.]